MINLIKISTRGQGLYEVTGEVREVVEQSRISEGLCVIFLQHTSAGLIIQENADPSARADLEKWMQKQVAENQFLYTHRAEGPDDMPAHIKAVLTGCSLSIPISAGKMLLGTWQGIYLWEFRTLPHSRKIQVKIIAG